MQAKEHFAHGHNPLDEKFEGFLLQIRRRDGLLVAQRRVEVVLPRQFVGRIEFARQGQLVLDKLGDFLLLDVLQIPVGEDG